MPYGSSNESVYCPECPPFINKHGRRIDAELELVESNYSGCCVDLAECQTCHKVWQISYKVDQVTLFYQGE